VMVEQAGRIWVGLWAVEGRSFKIGVVFFKVRGRYSTEQIEGRREGVIQQFGRPSLTSLFVQYRTPIQQPRDRPLYELLHAAP